MNGIALALVSAGALFESFFNISSKRGVDVAFKGRESLLVTLYSGGAGVILLFLFFTLHRDADIVAGFWFAMWATIVLNVGIQWLQTRAKAVEDVSLVTPIAASTPAIVIVTSMILLREYPSVLGWIGIYFLVVGTYVLNVQGYLNELRVRGDKVGWREWLAPFILLSRSAGVRYAFSAAVLGAVSLNYDGLIVRRADAFFALGTKWMLVGALSGFWVWRKNRFRVRINGKLLPAPSTNFLLVVMALAIAISGSLNAFAYRLAIVPYVGSLKRLSIPFTVVLAYLLVGERTMFRSRLVGGFIMAIGVALIGLS